MAALVLSSSGPLNEYVTAPAIQFCCVFCFPVSPTRRNKRQEDLPAGGQLNHAIPHARAFCIKLLAALALFANLNP